ncbi:MAG: OB-fold domain-containing protein [Polyangiaceae bacterium]|nr:OB-fold domain-containing protein [Myxococcales bacterium]MCB9586640.1 OB-fold domain-containing protein [Polyangiaceae bacterium]MCB9606147.1 OB-fold domain-containing protein [Polyangiaceae bacterium]
MSETKTRVPAVPGLFTLEPEVALVGSRCSDCGSYFFPREQVVCRNPRCRSSHLEACELSRAGKLWSFTSSAYKPPPPFVAPEPFEPFALAAVELEREKLVVLGQVVRGVLPEALRVGMPMQLTSEVLEESDSQVLMVWKWAPSGAASIEAKR